MAEVIIQEALAKSEGTEHPLPRETLSGPGTPHKQQVACRTIHTHTYIHYKFIVHTKKQQRQHSRPHVMNTHGIEQKNENEKKILKETNDDQK